MNRPVYMDYAAATPLDPRVVKVMVDCLTLEGSFANPSSKDHVFGWEAAEVVENIDIILIGGVGSGTGTSGGSESICCLHFDDAFKNYILTNDVSSYAYLQEWKNERINGNEGNFRQAISKQFPWITSQKSTSALSSQLSSEPFFSEALANNWVYIVNNTTSCS